MVHNNFVQNAISKIKEDNEILGLALGGSWITNEIDEYSDVDMILVTKNKIPPDEKKMISYAKKFGDLLNGFTGEHVGEKRVLICLYDNPLLHVDIKFLIPDELYNRVENPVVVWERDHIISKVIKDSVFNFPSPNFQWIENRFWTWVHYVAAKIGRGELFEAHDAISFLRSNVIAPLLQIKNNNLPKALRKIEFIISKDDLEKLKKTIPQYEVQSIIKSMEENIKLYIELRKDVYTENIKQNERIQQRSLDYFNEIKDRINNN